MYLYISDAYPLIQDEIQIFNIKLNNFVAFNALVFLKIYMK